MRKDPVRKWSACLLPTLDSSGEKIYPDRLIIQARNVGEFFAAGLFEIFGSLNPDLLESLKAIGHKGRRDDEQAFLALFWQSLKQVVGIGG